MKFINPSEISSKIMTLFDESDEFVILVSPYVKISKWYKLIKKLDRLKTRNIPFEFIIRDDNSNLTSFNELNGLNYKYSCIKDLHSKVYLNEKYAIVTSMNLLLSSEINSIELGYKTDTKEEHEELLKFYRRYLSIKENAQEMDSIPPQYADWRDYVVDQLSQKLNTQIRAQQDRDAFLLNTGINNYQCFISKEPNNRHIFQISGILSKQEFKDIPAHFSKVNNSSLHLVLIPGKGNYYDTILGSLKQDLKSYSLDRINENESKTIANSIIDFIEWVDCFKRS